MISPVNQAPMAWRATPGHRALQVRLERMRPLISPTAHMAREPAGAVMPAPEGVPATTVNPAATAAFFDWRALTQRYSPGSSGPL